MNCSIDSSIERIRAWHNSLASNKMLKKSKVLMTKLKLVFYRFQLSETSVRNKLSSAQLAKLLAEWDDTDMDVKYFELIERSLFDAYAINAQFVNEFDESSLSGELEDHKLYKRVNDVDKNESRYLALKAQSHMPFHINAALLYKFSDDSPAWPSFDKFNKKIVEYIQLIKVTAAATLAGKKQYIFTLVVNQLIPLFPK